MLFCSFFTIYVSGSQPFLVGDTLSMKNVRYKTWSVDPFPYRFTVPGFEAMPQEMMAVRHLPLPLNQLATVLCFKIITNFSSKQHQFLRIDFLFVNCNFGRAFNLQVFLQQTNV